MNHNKMYSRILLSSAHEYWVSDKALAAGELFEEANVQNRSLARSRSQMNRLLLVCVWLLFQCSSLLIAQETATQVAQEDVSVVSPNELKSIELSWGDGDRMQGRLSQWDSSGLRVQSGLFRNSLDIETAKLELIRFPAIGLPSNKSTTAEPNAPNADPHSLVLIDGSQLRGQFIESKGEMIRFRDYRFGELQISTQQVASISSALSSLYTWSGNLEPWQQASSKLPGKWEVDGANLVSKQANSQLWLPLSLNESFSIDFAVQSESSLDFVIATGLDPEKSLRLGRIGDSWILGTADNFEIIEQFVPQTKKLESQLKWEPSTRTLALYENNSLVLAVKDPEASSLRSGIFLANQGKSLTVTRIQANGLAESTSTSLPQISKTVVQPNSGVFDWLQWSDGSSIWCEVESILAGQLKLQFVGQSVSCPIEGLQVIKPRRITAPTNEVLASTESRTGKPSDDSPSLLIYGQNRLSGRFEVDAKEQKIVWHSVKFSQPAEIDHSRQMQLKQSGFQAAPDSYRQLRDVVSLENGDQLPCRLQRASSTQAWLELPFASEPFVTPLDQLRALELNSFSSKRASFTEESRKMLLSIPRNLEEDSYTHAAIGRNGDLLRGDLISVNEDKVEIDSKLTPMVFDRSVVAALVKLQPKAKPIEKTTESNGQTQKSSIDSQGDSEHLLRIQLPSTYSISGRWLGGTQDSILLENPSLGICSVSFAQVQGLVFGPVTADDTQGYFAWNTALTISPRWKASAESVDQAASELVGTQAPQLELADIDGQTFRLADHVGKVVVLDFWATWCGPCVASLPKYLEVAAQFPDTEVLFLGVNSTETPETIREFLRTKDWKGFSNLMDFDRSAAGALRVQGIPHTVVIGPDGKIEHIHVGYTNNAAEQLKQEIQQLLNP